MSTAQTIPSDLYAKLLRRYRRSKSSSLLWECEA
jgi:hypothetical protein